MHFTTKGGVPFAEAQFGQPRAIDDYTAALHAVTAELKQQTVLAQRSSSEFQKAKFLADVLSGQFGRGIKARRPATRLERIVGRLVALYVICKAL